MVERRWLANGRRFIGLAAERGGKRTQLARLALAIRGELEQASRSPFRVDQNGMSSSDDDPP